MPIEQRIVEMADLCGKRSSDGGIKTFEEVLAYGRESRLHYQETFHIEPLYPSEKRLDVNVVHTAELVYRALHEWFSIERVDLKAIQQEILQEELQHKTT